MKPKEKRWILILIIITIIMIIILNSRGKKEEVNVEQGQNESVAQSDLVKVLEDGTKQGTSEKLKENKKMGVLEFSNVQIVEKNGIATLTANVTNNGNATMQERAFQIKLLNKSGETIETLGALVGTIRAGETRGINAQIDMDISQIYDIAIEM